MMYDERCVVFGTGIVGRRAVKQLGNFGIFPIAFCDNNSRLWGTELMDIPIIAPSDIKNLQYDMILISTSDYYDSIYDQLVNELKVDLNKVKCWDYFLREEFLDHYGKELDNLNEEKKQIYNEVLKKDRLEAFNYPFVEKYDEQSIMVVKDEAVGLYYYNYNDHKMYLSRNYNTVDKARKYLNSILIEQDIQSPHRYLDDRFGFEGGVVLDAGVAEGNFSLDLVEKAQHIVMVEADPLWVEALNHTFAPYKDKITILNKFLGDRVDTDKTTIDEISEKHHIDFIKMDIEGSEMEALNGGIRTLSRGTCKKLAICSYHNIEDEERIRSLLEDNYCVSTTDGYMLYPFNEKQMVRMVRGIVRAERV